MATTTNYGWTTPDDTALVKDGASAIRTLGSSIDTSVKALNPGTTSGDLDYYTAATTKARIAKGTAGQVFTMNAGATAPEWQTASSGGMTLLSTTSLTGATTTISGISGSYNTLTAIVYGVTNATADNVFRCAPNGSTTISTSVRNSSSSVITSTSDNYMLFSGLDMDRASSANSWVFNIYNYANTSSRKPFNISGVYTNVTVARGYFASGDINTTSAITSLVFSNSGGNLSTGTVLLYGVK